LDASLRDYHERFAADRNAAAAFEGLETHLAEREAWLELASLYRRRLEASSLAGQPQARAQLQLRLGATLEDRLCDEEGALSAYRESARLDPTSRVALQRLRGLYARRGSYDVVLQVAELEVSSAMSAAERALLLDEMAQIWEREFADPQQAAACRARADEERPAACGDAPSVAGDDASHRDDPVSDGGDQALVHQAWLASARGDTEAAIDCYVRLIEERPRDPDARAALLELHRARGDAEPLVRALRAELARADGEGELSIHLEVAGLLERRLSDPAGALSHLRRAIELQPGDEGIAERALGLAEAVGGAFGRLDLIDHAVGVEAPARTRARWLLRRGDLLAAEIGWPDEATQCWRAALDLAPDLAGARERLEKSGDTGPTADGSA
jgi:tetratricopeptide (TPR) repeat protein